MDSQNIHGITSQLKSITVGIDKIAEGVNNPWTVWVPLAGVIVALALGVDGIFQDRIRYWLRKPKLRVTFKEPAAIITDGNYGNIPHYNFAFKIENIGKSTLEDAEALVSDIWKLNGGEEKKLNPMPFNLRWNINGSITIPKIPSNTYKLFNFGDILKPDPQLPQSSFVNFRPPSSIEFFNKEINSIKSPGESKIKIIFSGNNADPLIKTYKLKINNNWVEDVKNIKGMLSIEEC